MHNTVPFPLLCAVPSTPLIPYVPNHPFSLISPLSKHPSSLLAYAPIPPSYPRPFPPATPHPSMVQPLLEADKKAPIVPLSPYVPNHPSIQNELKPETEMPHRATHKLRSYFESQRSKKLYNAQDMRCEYCLKQGHTRNFCPTRPTEPTHRIEWVDRLIVLPQDHTYKRFQHKSWEEARAIVEKMGAEMNRGTPG
jgi:hypothetical protein